MKNILKRVPKKLFAAVATLALVAGVASGAMAAFGPDREIRDFANNQGGFDHVTFNSFVNVPNGIGDERDFFRGHQVGTGGTWSDPVNGVAQGAEVEMHILVHNNANPVLNDSGEGVAKDVNVRAELPAGSAQSQQATAYISASNATPTQIYDTLDLTGANSGFFELEYIPGSAKMFNHENGQTTAISDSLVTTGVNLPDQKGCVNYIREITFRVKVKMPRYQIQKAVRLKGEDNSKWRDAANAKIGDTVEWEIWFKNSGQTVLEDVTIVDDLPPYLTVVPGSIKLYKGPNSMTVPDDAIQKNGRQINVNTGDYNPGNDAYIRFATTIDNNEVIACGIHELGNVAYATPKGYKHINDSAKVNVLNDDDCEEPSFICESLEVEKLGGRKVRVTVKAPAQGGAEFKNLTLNFGDGSENKVTDQLVNEYEYAEDGTYKISTSVTFKVDGTDKTVSSDACAAMVTFGEEVPEELPSTGAGSMIGLFAVVTLAVAAAHNVISRRVA